MYGLRMDLATSCGWCVERMLIGAIRNFACPRDKVSLGSPFIGPVVGLVGSVL